MPLSNTAERYGTVTKAFHWLTALMIVMLIPLGLAAANWPQDGGAALRVKATLFSLHKTLGVALFAVASLRIVWALCQRRPAPLRSHRDGETLAADTAHWLLYGSLVLVPLSGWIHHAASAGGAPIWGPIGQSLPLVPKDAGIAGVFAGLHIVFNAVLALALIAHIAGALKHHLLDRDTTLRRMWFGRAPQVDVARARRVAWPLAGALALWAVAIVLAGAGGLFAPRGVAVGVVAPAPAQSGWTMQDGTLALTVTQFGSQVQGRFTDWSAEIAFDPSPTRGPAGSVRVVVAVGSLTLGALDSQAMGPDFFDAATYPVATFTADIVQITDGYAADGTLGIRDRIVPVRMPFGLSVDGDVASMTGSLTLDRRSFGIGDNLADESILKFAVTVDVALTAVRDAE